MSFSPGQIYRVKIDRLSHPKGYGVGRIEGMVCFVEGACPNDILEIELLEVKKNHLLGRALNVLSPSEFRRKPPCEVFGSCGGCSWQHVDYEEQLRQKQQILEFALGPVLPGTFSIPPMLRSPNEYRYRNRIQVTKTASAVGFFKRGSNDVIPVRDCLIAEKSVAEGIQDLEDSKTKEGRYEIARPWKGQIFISKASRDPEQLMFSQVNAAQNNRLNGLVKDAARKIAPQSIFDLYSGHGNFSFKLAEELPNTAIKAVELSQSSVAMGQGQITSQQIEFIQSDVEAFLKEVAGEKNLLIILDPPRPGISKGVLEQLRRIGAPNIIYISCNPATLARDLKGLFSFYRPRAVQGLDMFPQTPHIEVFTHLELRTDAVR